MHRYAELFERAHIDMADLPPDIEVNGVLIYLGTFPHGSGRLLVNPAVPIGETPEFVALVAHELSHLLLSRFMDHPPCTIQYLLARGQRQIYDRYEEEADNMAAVLLVPREMRHHFPSARYPTMRRLASELGVPLRVVRRALTQRLDEYEAIRDEVFGLIDAAAFLPIRLAEAA